jgi:hypothetical protein
MGHAVAHKPRTLIETADVACGGNPWGASFLDTFRYLDQLGRLARQGVNVVMHNTLAASDYSLLDERAGFTPKPNYWAALLWRRLMGATVLESGIPVQAGLHVYAHCLRDTPGGVALLAINTDRTTPRIRALPASLQRGPSAAGLMWHVEAQTRHAGASFVLLSGHVFQPVHRLAIEFFLNRDVRHRRGRRRTMPVLLAWRKPYDIAGPNLLDRPTPTLRASNAGSHDQRLTERVSVPCRALVFLELRLERLQSGGSRDGHEFTPSPGKWSRFTQVSY